MATPPKHDPDKISVQNKIQHCSGLLHTPALNDWETEFIGSLSSKLSLYGNDFHISEKQDYHLNKIWSKHFANAAVLPAVPPQPKDVPQSKTKQELDDELPF